MHGEKTVFTLILASQVAVSVKLHINVLVPVKSMEILWLVWRKFSNWLKVNALKCFNTTIYFHQVCFGRN